MTLAKDRLPGNYAIVQKFGRIPDIDNTDTNEDVWDGEGAYTFPSAATAMKISSSSANDAAAGTGARTVKLYGLDTNWNEVIQTVTLNGQTGVAITTSLLRVYRAKVLTAGTGEVNAGDIWIGTGVITDGVPAVKYAGIKTGMGQTLMAIYTIPDDFEQGHITRWYASMNASKAAYASVALQVRENGGAWQTKRVSGVSEGAAVDDKLTWPLLIPTKTDVRVRVLLCGTDNSVISAGFDIALEEL